MGAQARSLDRDGGDGDGSAGDHRARCICWIRDNGSRGASRRSRSASLTASTRGRTWWACRVSTRSNCSVSAASALASQFMKRRQKARRSPVGGAGCAGLTSDADPTTSRRGEGFMGTPWVARPVGRTRIESRPPHPADVDRRGWAKMKHGTWLRVQPVPVCAVSASSRRRTWPPSGSRACRCRCTACRTARRASCGLGTARREGLWRLHGHVRARPASRPRRSVDA